jgi:hypothetical protein
VFAANGVKWKTRRLPMDRIQLPEDLTNLVRHLEGNVVKWRENKLKGTTEGTIVPFSSSKFLHSITVPSSGLPGGIAEGDSLVVLGGVLPRVVAQIEKGHPVDTILLGEEQEDLNAQLWSRHEKATDVNKAIAGKKRYAAWELGFVQEEIIQARGPSLYDTVEVKGLIPPSDAAAALGIDEALYEVDQALRNLPIGPETVRGIKGTIESEIRKHPNPANLVFGDYLIELLDKERQRHLFEGNYDKWTALCVARIKLHINLASRIVLPFKPEYGYERVDRYATLLKNCPEVLQYAGSSYELYNGLDEHIRSSAGANLGWRRPLPVTPLQPGLATELHKAIAIVRATLSSAPWVEGPVDELEVYLRPFQAIKDLYRIVKGTLGTSAEERELVDQIMKHIDFGFKVWLRRAGDSYIGHDYAGSACYTLSIAQDAGPYSVQALFKMEE